MSTVMLGSCNLDTYILLSCAFIIITRIIIY